MHLFSYLIRTGKEISKNHTHIDLPFVKPEFKLEEYL